MRESLTEDEHIAMVACGNRFWLEFSKLCWHFINEAPEDLREHYRMYLGDKTSIYGIADDR